MSTVKYLYPVEIPVHWGDQDALGHVNNALFFRYFETARIHMMTVSGIWQAFQEKNLYVVLGKIECNFLKSIHYPETIIAQCGIVSIGNSSIVVEHQILLKSNQQLVANGNGILVCADPVEQKSVKIPEDLKMLIQNKLT